MNFGIAVCFGSAESLSEDNQLIINGRGLLHSQKVVALPVYSETTFVRQQAWQRHSITSPRFKLRG